MGDARRTKFEMGMRDVRGAGFEMGMIGMGMG
jgi:hypothetical protein